MPSLLLLVFFLPFYSPRLKAKRLTDVSIVQKGGDFMGADLNPSSVL